MRDLKRNITVDLKTVSPTDLSEILRKFFAEVKTEKGQALTFRSGDIHKLNQYFMEGHNAESVWKNVEKLVEVIWFSLCFNSFCAPCQ